MAFYDKDFDIEIETRWWSLMSRALKDKLLCVSLEKHLDSNNFVVLKVKIYPVNKEPKVIYSKFDSEHSTSLFYDAERFIKEYKKDKND